jgi:outer membrane protein OmpA-like peptidoglycan-associated protein
MSSTERGAVIGVGAGGAIGAVIGDAAGSTAKGAIIGAVVGGTAGAVIGRRMDEKAETLDDELEGATVERVGEGILVTFASGILFDFDSSTLRDEARANLTELADALADEERDYELLVAGHTDSVGTETYNQRLAERRAEAAANFLVTRGLPPDRLRRVGLGESEPVADNDTEAGRQRNRRVEVAIFASEEYREEMVERYGG